MHRDRPESRAATSGVLARATTLAALALPLAGLAFLWSAGFLDRSPVRLFAAQGRRAPVSALFLSGDMGLRYGMGAATCRALAAHGISVTGLSSSTLFATHKSRAQLDRIVSDAIRAALADNRGKRLVLIGQSFGADVLQTGLAGLPRDLRPRIAAVVLVVPGRTVFFRADPLGFAYAGEPDSRAADTIRAITWAPVTCIYGTSETDSVCPALKLPNARIVPMPGGHLLNRNGAALQDQVLKSSGVWG